MDATTFQNAVKEEVPTPAPADAPPQKAAEVKIDLLDERINPDAGQYANKTLFRQGMELVLGPESESDRLSFAALTERPLLREVGARQLDSEGRIFALPDTEDGGRAYEYATRNDAGYLSSDRDMTVPPEASDAFRAGFEEAARRRALGEIIAVGQVLADGAVALGGAGLARGAGGGVPKIDPPLTSVEPPQASARRAVKAHIDNPEIIGLIEQLHTPYVRPDGTLDADLLAQAEKRLSASEVDQPVAIRAMARPQTRVESNFWGTDGRGGFSIEVKTGGLFGSRQLGSASGTYRDTTLTIDSITANPRGQGYGSDMMSTIEQEAKARGITEIRAQVRGSAEGFYEKMGYQNEGGRGLNTWVKRLN